MGVPRGGPGKWASCIRVLDPKAKQTLSVLELVENEAAVSVAAVPLRERGGETFILVGTVKDMTLHPRSVACGFISVYQLTDGNTTLSLVHKTQVRRRNPWFEYGRSVSASINSHASLPLASTLWPTCRTKERRPAILMLHMQTTQECGERLTQRMTPHPPPPPGRGRPLRHRALRRPCARRRRQPPAHLRDGRQETSAQGRAQEPAVHGPVHSRHLFAAHRGRRPRRVVPPREVQASRQLALHLRGRCGTATPDGGVPA